MESVKLAWKEGSLRLFSDERDTGGKRLCDYQCTWLIPLFLNFSILFVTT